MASGWWQIYTCHCTSPGKRLCVCCEIQPANLKEIKISNQCFVPTVHRKRVFKLVAQSQLYFLQLKNVKVKTTRVYSHLF